MNNFWVKNKYRIVGALGLAVLYLCFVGAWWVLTGAQGGERFGFLILLLNLPMFLFFEFIKKWVGHYENIYSIIVGLGGPLQFGLIGWFLGPILERFDLEGQKERQDNSPNKKK